MPLLTSRQAQPFLLHAVIWLLVGFLVAVQPGSQLPEVPFYLLQGSLFVASLGVFYLNAEWAVPRLLYKRRWVSYALFLLGLVLAVAIPHRQAQRALEKHYGVGPPFFRPQFQRSGAPFNQRPPSGRQPARRMRQQHNEWVNPAVMFSTLLVLGLSTSVAAVQRGQRDAQIRQALEQEKLTTELAWLKAQINPHFFFNTLNNIYSLTLLDGDEAREAILRLSRMMRYVLYDTQAGTAPLSQELLFIRDYIDLMQLRLTDNVQVRYDTPANLHDAPIAPMLLLTFVENAFKHGVSALAPSHIHITVRQPTLHTLDVEVRNSVFAERPVALDENHGIGLTNTRRRLALLYPERHTLTVTKNDPAHEYYVHLTLTLQA
ncbi:histidine kinase [Hymenobacter sp. BT186]|uniref:Histidine kinase n=1 Tax=Hymenobacter telluris TaxID=2816474 RepID=A0A939J7P3_9BACT|nr:histidine kinase [Hymenobacter telluris]MBO0356934.1 histidine kinase [Hymenobacter telluris]MBW3372961.1 histidine kinase [Hymenobacter norwichensis]